MVCVFFCFPLCSVEFVFSSARSFVMLVLSSVAPLCSLRLVARYAVCAFVCLFFF
jgi:hypothetical protein